MWRNWSGGQAAAPRETRSIADEAQLSDAIRSAPGPVKVVGAGHSFTPLLVCDGTHLALDGFTGVGPAPDDGSGRLAARAGAGIVLSALTERMHAQGLALENMGDVDGQRLGGALATATHGTGEAFQTYSAMIRRMVLFDGRGARHEFTRARDADALRAMAVSLGTGGIITEVDLDAVPSYRLEKRRLSLRLPDLIADLHSHLSAARNAEFYYIPHSGVVLGLQSDIATGPNTPRPRDRDQQGLRQLKLATRLLSRLPRLRRWLLSRLLLTHTDEHFTQDWHHCYPTARDAMRFEETEWHIPLESAPAALAEVTALIDTHMPDLFFPMEIRLTGGDDLWLSPFQGGPRVSIAVHHEAGAEFDPILRAVEPIMLRHGGRPHWGKRHNLRAADLRGLYPDFDRAVELRRALDPEGRFVTPYLDALLGWSA